MDSKIRYHEFISVSNVFDRQYCFQDPGKGHSQEEVAHHLLSFPYVKSSHNIISVPVYKPKDLNNVIINGQNRVRKQYSVWSKYCTRDERWGSLTFFQFLSMLDYSKKDWTWLIECVKPRVFNYFSRYPSD